jgi:hypothetical protein
MLPRDRATATPPWGVVASCWLAAPSPGPAMSVSPASSWPPAGRSTSPPCTSPSRAAEHRLARPPRPGPGHGQDRPAHPASRQGLSLEDLQRRSRTFSAGQTFLEYGPEDVNLTRNETAAVTETVVTFLLPVGAPITVDAPAPDCQL